MTTETHLSDSELFALAAPAAGEPEPLPEHLSRCQVCSRALIEWKESVLELGREEVAEIDGRPPEEWGDAREATMAAVRRAAGPGSSPGRALRWVLAAAATLLLVYLAMPRQSEPVSSAASTTEVPAPVTSEFASSADRDDDALLREAAHLARGGDDDSDIAMEESL